MNLVLVRHTKTDSPYGVCYGQTDVGVYQTFRKDQKKILKNLKNINFHQVYTSPLRRCRLLSQNFENVVADKRLMELNFGDWENIRWDEINKTADGKRWFNDFLNIPCPNGESFVDLQARVKDFLTEILRKHKNENVLVFCHAGTIRAFNVLINNWETKNAFDLKPRYGQVFKYNSVKTPN